MKQQQLTCNSGCDKVLPIEDAMKINEPIQTRKEGEESTHTIEGSGVYVSEAKTNIASDIISSRGLGTTQIGKAMTSVPAPKHSLLPFSACYPPKLAFIKM